MTDAISERLSTAAFRAVYGDRAIDVGGAYALRSPELPTSPMLNRVVGLGVERPATQATLDEIASTMGGRGYYVAVSPSAAPAELGAWLQARGYTPGWGWMQFKRDVSDPAAVATDVDVVAVGPADGATFARAVAASYGMPQAVEPWLAETPTCDGWTCWLALTDGEPIAAAGLFVAEGKGYLGFAGTLADHRGKGAQAALLAARIRRARELGCEAVFTETGELLPDRPSSSYRNIVRAGFEELYVVGNWLSPAPG